MRWWRSAALPDSLRDVARADGRVLAAGSAVGADADHPLLLAATRFGLWVVDGDGPRRLDWALVSKATMADRVLTLVLAQEVARWPDGTVLLRDSVGERFHLCDASGLTDVVHARVRASVAASCHISEGGLTGWLVLRRVPGQDGLTVQVRADPEVADVQVTPSRLAWVASRVWDLRVESGLIQLD